MKKKRINTRILGAQDLDAFVMNPKVDWDNITMAFVSGGQGGGKIASEFCRLGFPLLAYNTSKEDLDDLKNIINSMPEETRGEFKPIYLPGEGGASKDRDVGYQAIKDNLEIIQENMVDDENIKSADFVWLVLSLGGGTGNGSLALVAKIIALIREGKKIVRGGVEKPTFGIIAALPDKRTVKSKIAINVALAISEMDELHRDCDLGAVVLIDNKKLVDDFNMKYHNVPTKRTWSTDGNTKVARIITELALSTNLSGSEVLDKSEMLDIWSTPGYLTLGKMDVQKGWISKYLKSAEIREDEKGEFEKYVDVEEKKLSLEDKEKIFTKLVKDSFEKSIFVSGIDLDTAIHGGMIVMTDGNVISTKDSKLLEMAMNMNVLYSDAVEAPHFAFIKNDEYLGTVQSPKKKGDVGDGRIFAMCVSYTPPQYIVDWFKEAKDKSVRNRKSLEEFNTKSKSIGKIINGLDADSHLRKSKTKDLASSLSDLIMSDRGIQVKKSAPKTKISLKDLIKETKVKDTSNSSSVSSKLGEEIKRKIVDDRKREN